MQLEQDTIGLSYQPTTVIYNGKEYPAPQVINLFEWEVRNVIIDLLKNKNK
jgi:hypothetical protein